eukprot:gene24420-10018_t
MALVALGDTMCIGLAGTLLKAELETRLLSIEMPIDHLKSIVAPFRKEAAKERANKKAAKASRKLQATQGKRDDIEVGDDDQPEAKAARTIPGSDPTSMLHDKCFLSKPMPSHGRTWGQGMSGGGAGGQQQQQQWGGGPQDRRQRTHPPQRDGPGQGAGRGPPAGQGMISRSTLVDDVQMLGWDFQTVQESLSEAEHLLANYVKERARSVLSKVLSDAVPRDAMTSGQEAVMEELIACVRGTFRLGIKELIILQHTSSAPCSSVPEEPAKHEYSSLRQTRPAPVRTNVSPGNFRLSGESGREVASSSSKPTGNRPTAAPQLQFVSPPPPPALERVRYPTYESEAGNHASVSSFTSSVTLSSSSSAIDSYNGADRSGTDNSSGNESGSCSGNDSGSGNDESQQADNEEASLTGELDGWQQFECLFSCPDEDRAGNVSSVQDASLNLEGVTDRVTDLIQPHVASIILDSSSSPESEAQNVANANRDAAQWLGAAPMNLTDPNQGMPQAISQSQYPFSSPIQAAPKSVDSLKYQMLLSQSIYLADIIASLQQQTLSLMQLEVDQGLPTDQSVYQPHMNQPLSHSTSVPGMHGSQPDSQMMLHNNDILGMAVLQGRVTQQEQYSAQKQYAQLHANSVGDMFDSVGMQGLATQVPQAQSDGLAGAPLSERFNKLPVSIRERIIQVLLRHPFMTPRDFDIKVIRKLANLVNTYGEMKGLVVLDNISSKLNSKQEASMRNTRGYLDVAIGSYLESLRSEAKAAASVMKLGASQLCGHDMYSSI